MLYVQFCTSLILTFQFDGLHGPEKSNQFE